MLRRAFRGDAHAVGLGRAHELGRRRARHVQHVVAPAGALRRAAGRGPRSSTRLPRAGPGCRAAPTTRLRACAHRARARDLRRVARGPRPGSAAAYSNACRITSASATQSPSSVKTRTPRSYSSPIGASSSPRRPLVMQPVGPYVAQPDGARTIEDRLHDRGVVDRRIGVRHADDRSAAAERGGTRAGLDRLRVFAARFPEVHLDVDESGRHDAALGVEHGRARRRRQAPAPTSAITPSTTRTSCSTVVAVRVEDAAALDEQLHRSDNRASGAEQRPEHGHAHRYAVGNLFGHERAGRVGDLARDLDARGSSGRDASRACRACTAPPARRSGPSAAEYSRSDGNNACPMRSRWMRSR